MAASPTPDWGAWTMPAGPGGSFSHRHSPPASHVLGNTCHLCLGTPTHRRPCAKSSLRCLCSLGGLKAAVATMTQYSVFPSWLFLPDPFSQPPDPENGILSLGLSEQLRLMLRCFDTIMEYLLCFYDFYQTWALKKF